MKENLLNLNDLEKLEEYLSEHMDEIGKDLLIILLKMKVTIASINLQIIEDDDEISKDIKNKIENLIPALERGDYEEFTKNYLTLKAVDNAMKALKERVKRYERNAGID